MVERLSVMIGADELHFETGRIAKQAQGAVICRAGDTMVLSAVTVAPEARPGTDFLPMTVDYREKFYAVGQIPGNFFRREARPSEREILVCRLTDRPLRPLFPKGFYNELQVCQTVLSADNIHDPGVLSINAASAALHISKAPLQEPIGAVRVGFIDGELVVNPSIEAMHRSEINITMAGTANAITMVEGAAREASEELMLEALEFGHEYIKMIIDTIEELRNRVGQPKMEIAPPPQDDAVTEAVERLAADKLRNAINNTNKQERHAGVDAVKQEVRETLAREYGEEAYEEKEPLIKGALSALQKRLMREQVVQLNRRLDGRGLADIRQISVEVGVLPRAHGSALFTRGETQALVVTTLGTSRDEQRIDELTGDEFRRFFLHYNFPSWSVGEVRRIMGPGRREIGHGKLAERAIEYILPFTDDDDPDPDAVTPAEGGDAAGNGNAASPPDFPYTIRIVSEITESNGSSSMASVCGGSLSLMDAGVPVTAPVAGIAMGLIKEGGEVRVLSDILGDEDHLGDMDFKVCGTSEGITAFQMDTKIAGISREVMFTALDQARKGREHILAKMNEVISEPRPEVSPYAPRIYTIQINPDKIRDVIGPGGKVIREIQNVTGAEIEIQDDGTVKVAAVNKEEAEAAIDMIQSITADVEVGKIYHGRVTRIMNFGAFVQVLGTKEGLVHISELDQGHVREVTDVLNIGDEVDVKVIEIDQMGRVNLSKIQADIELGHVTPDPDYVPGGRGGDRGGRGGDRGGRGGDRGGRGGDRGGRGGGGRGGDRGGRGGGGGRR